MPKYEVGVKITKTYVTHKTINVFAKDEENAEDKARDIVDGWSKGGAEEVEIDICGVMEQ